MRTMSPSELRLISRLAIDSSLRQAGLARDLHVTRSAVNQIWQNLERENGLKIRGNLDYGKVGLQMVFGWAIASEESNILEKFHRWLKSSKLVTLALQSLISSTFNSLVYFEALLPLDSQYGWFQNQIDRFRKKPYSLTLYTCDCSKISYHLNLGLFDGTNWNFPESFRLEASIGAARGYVDILPVVGTVEQSSPSAPIIDGLIVAAAIESDYNTDAPSLASAYSGLGLKPSSDRTLRRRIARARKKLAAPYVEISNIGLDQHIMVSFRDDVLKESVFSRVLHAQASTFPKARVLSGPGLTLLDLEVPSNINWLPLSQVMSGLAGNSSEICTFIANQREKSNRLESVVSYLASRASSG
ncbi:MAG: hypothetical protein C4K48_05570 [Candidatus Thorarchaeota archaeon]|nr:MAG: hypothetical protein C4K48_05570 [Candidatus Thorarchaeota archaeon]